MCLLGSENEQYWSAVGPVLVAFFSSESDGMILYWSADEAILVEASTCIGSSADQYRLIAPCPISIQGK